jgi:hypothetical protein
MRSVGGYVGTEMGEIEGLRLDGDYGCLRIAQCEQDRDHPDMGADIHDYVARFERYPSKPILVAVQFARDDISRA